MESILRKIIERSQKSKEKQPYQEILRISNEIEEVPGAHGVEHARRITQEGHKNQKPRHDGSEYFSHPREVAKIIFDNSENLDPILRDLARVIALIHDLAEDEKETHWNIERIKEEFTGEVGDIVEALSENKDLRDLHEENMSLWEDQKDYSVKEEKIESSREQKELPIPAVKEEKIDMKLFMLEDSFQKIDGLKKKNQGFYEVAVLVRIADILHNTRDYKDQDEDLFDRNLEKIKRIYEKYEGEGFVGVLKKRLEDRIEKMKEFKEND